MTPALRLAALAAVCVACATARGAQSQSRRAPGDGQARRASARAIADYLRARLAEGAGDGAGAVEALRMSVARDPDSPQLRVSYAEALARVGRLDAAEGEARRAVELATTGGAAAADAHLVLGKVLAAAGRTGPAERELERAVALEGARVRTAITGAVEREPPAVDAEPWRALADLRLGRGDAVAAVAACDDLAAIDRVAAAATLRELSAKLLQAKDPAAAERIVRRSLELAPSDGAAWKLLARAQEDQERLADARVSLQKALVADPADGEALLSAGQLALKQGDVPSARAWFRQLLRVAPDEGLAKVRVAAAWLDAKHPSDALEAATGGDDAELLYLRGVALLQLRRWSDAAETLERVSPSSGDVYPYALYAAGECYERAGRHEAALAKMRAVLSVKPDHAEALNYLGYAFAERGERLDEAQALLERALQIEPDNAFFLDSLGWVFFKKGELARAVETLERAARLAGPEATILDHLGDAYRAAQRPADAASAYRRSLEAGTVDGDDEPGRAPGTRRALVQRKLDDLGSRATPPPTTRR